MKKLFTILAMVVLVGFSSAFAQHNVTVKVDMSKYAGTIGKVYVSGTFNSWSGDANELTDADSDGIYEGTVSITDSADFKFTMDNWAVQETFVGGESCTKTKGGFANRYVRVTKDTTLEVYCWNACTDCSQVPDPKNVTFRVDMKEYTGTYSTVNVNGTFNNWCGGCNPMTDMDNDSIWEVTITFPATLDSIDYKFSVDGWADQEGLTDGAPCTKTKGGFVNRFLEIDGNVTLPAVCWNSCGSCATSNKNNVTFKVDMGDYTGSYDKVNLNGDFAGWCGGCIEMHDNNNDSIFEVTVPVPDSIEYKFTLDEWAVQEVFGGGEPCTKSAGGFTNRFATPSGDTDLGVVCWEACADCDAAPTSGDITFSVDMSEYDGTWTNINLNGTFNSWCGGCNPMVDDNNDSIYTLTVNIPFDTIEWKFTVDGWTDEEKFAGGESCTRTVGDFTNRYMVFTQDTMLAVNCFNACVSCEKLSVAEKKAFKRFDVYPNPAGSVLNIDLVGNSNRIQQISLLNTVGKTSYQENVNTTELTHSLNVSHYPAGIYMIQVVTDLGLYTKKIVIQ